MGADEASTPVIQYATGRPPRRRRRRRIAVAAVAAVLVLVAVLSCVVMKAGRFATSSAGGFEWSAGKQKPSPDGRFRADGQVRHGNGRSWCTMEVVELSDERRIFYFEQPLGPGDRQPMFDQGNATHDGIVWAPDSSIVTFVGKNGQAIPVPVR